MNKKTDKNTLDIASVVNFLQSVEKMVKEYFYISQYRSISFELDEDDLFIAIKIHDDGAPVKPFGELREKIYKTFIYPNGWRNVYVYMEMI